jgi:hypothetical protein|tara:strand:- start:231 stop:782 length:552 start_codon:yes stop_codon:yes gene_type:complete
MQFTKDFKVGIRAGQVSVSFRTWQSPHAKVDGLYKLHPEGAVRVTSVEQVVADAITAVDAAAAGFDSVAALHEFLAVDAAEWVFRVAFDYVPEGVPIAEPLPLDVAIAKLDKMESRAASPWAYSALNAISENPGTRAGDLAPQFSWETPKFKSHIRRLKKLGLTESLEVGYRLSPLGQAVMNR